jgi:hypothetical protein
MKFKSDLQYKNNKFLQRNIKNIDKNRNKFL